MAIPANREEFIEYCLRKLGEPVLKVNVDPTQVEDRVDEALYRFYQRHFNAVEIIWAVYNTSDTDVTNGYLQMDNDIVGVTDVFRLKRSSNIFAADTQMQLAELQSLVRGNMVGMGINYYYTISMHLELLNQLFSPERTFDFNPITNKLLISSGTGDVNTTEGSVILRCIRKVHGTAAEDDPTGTSVHNIWKDKWFQDYTTALIQEQWGMNMWKYNGVALVGGVTLNGAQILEDAKQKINQLEEQLQLEFSLPPMGFFG